MALRKKNTQLDIEQESAPQSLVASASNVQIQAPVWRHYRLKDETWQQELWRFYDIIGEFHFAANYVGSACSRVRIYVAEVDELGRIGDETDDERIQAIAETLFGGPTAKAEKLRAIGINLTVAGECYLVGLSRRSGEFNNSDKWFVLAPSELKRHSGGMSFIYEGQRVQLRPGRDIAIRLWTPHPAAPDHPDSPGRSAMPILAELEHLSKYVASQLDSRLAGAGILPIPSDIEFPRGDDKPAGVNGLMEEIMEVGTASLEGRGSAAALFPILVGMKSEVIERMPEKPITFESVLSEQAQLLRSEAIRRLATSIDMPPEILQGASEANHWGMWYVEENAIKIHVEPLVVRIIDALTQAYLAPALKALGIDPSKYTFAYDVAPLTHRPNRLQDALNLFERGIVSREEVLRAGDYNPDVAAPSQKEENIRFIKEILLREPGLFASPELREAIGIEIDTVAGAEQPGADVSTRPPPPPRPERATQDTSATPEMPSETSAPSKNEPALQASILVPEDSPTLVASDILVTEALCRAGKKLLGTRNLRGQFRDVEPEKIHTKVAVHSRYDADQLLTGAWQRAQRYGLTASMVDVLHDYTCGLLTEAVVHDRSTLRMMLRNKGVL